MPMPNRLRLKLKLLLILLLGIPTAGAGLIQRKASATCGRCQQAQAGGVWGWSCVTAYGTSCVATSTGCTQCASCFCNS